MTARQRRKKRRNDIISICDEMRTDSMEGIGLDHTNYEQYELFDGVENCVGFKMSGPERRLAVVAFEEGAAIAKQSIWYK